jgi:hypothetical protein
MISAILTRAALAAIQLYRITISPYVGPACRFSPSCSGYAEQAIRKYGIIRGGVMTLRRVMRCHPFHAGGFDPVR